MRDRSGHGPIVIGLTGNIAVGKSTVAAMLAELGAWVLDADKLAHELMSPGTEVHRQIRERFGRQVLSSPGDPQSAIDRRALGAIVFRDPEALRDLEEIVHPAVIAETLRRLSACTADVAVIEAIKLLEAGMHRYCDAVWVVTASRAQQMERLMRTRGLTEAEAALRIDAQPSQGIKIAHADVIIDNSAGIESTRAQVIAAWQHIGEPSVYTEGREGRSHCDEYLRQESDGE
jgi:dephospho-CoA kinase